MNKIIVFLFLLLLGAFSASHAQMHWVSNNGPWYAYLEDLTIGLKDGRVVLYAAGSTGAYIQKSTDNGESWTHQTIEGMAGIPTCVATFCSNADIVYAGVGVPSGGPYNSTIYKSTNGGNTWTPSASIPNPRISRIAVHPINPQIIWVGCSWFEYPDPLPVLYHSVNGGQNWITMVIGQPDPHHLSVSDIAVVGDPRYVWVSTYGGTERNEGVWQTTNGGSDWVRKIEGMDPANLHLASLAVDPNNPNVLYAGNRYTPGQTKLYKTETGTESCRWLGLGNTPTGLFQYRDIKVSPNDSRTLYVSTFSYTDGTGVLRTTDGGESWITSSNGINIPRLTAVEINPLNSDIIFTGGYGEFYKSEDGGTRWKHKNTGFELASLSVVAKSGSVIFASQKAGRPLDNFIFKSEDEGQTWEVVLFAPFRQFFDIKIMPGAPKFALCAGQTGYGVGLQPNSAAGYATVQLTTDGGSYWNEIYINRIVLEVVTSVTYEGMGSDRIYSTVKHSGINRASSVWKSDDRGFNWQISLIPIPELELYTSSIILNTIYVGGTLLDGAAVFKSTDRGSTWNQVNNGLPAGIVLSLSTDPVDPQVAYAATSSMGVYKTTNGGINWFESSNGISYNYMKSILVHPVNHNVIYVASTGIIYRSTDAGFNWMDMQTGTSTPSINSLTIDPTNPNAIYAATYAGVYHIPHIWSGEIVTNTTWKSGNTYLVEGKLTIPEGKILTIEPGAKVKLYEGAGIYAYGILHAEGTLSQPVSFQKADDKMWYGIIIHNPDNSIIKHCKISGAQYGVAYMGLEDKIYPSLSNSEIRDCTEGIRLYGNVQYKIDHPIKQNIIENCVYGIVVNNTDAEYPSRGENRPRFDYNTIKNCEKNGVWAARSRPVFFHNQIINNSEEGVILTDEGNAEFGQKQTPGYNTIANNGKWQVSVSYSNPLIGLVDDEKLCNPIAGGMNRIFHNSDEVGRVKAIGGGTVVQADKTFWGWPIDPRWFEDDGKAIIIARCPINPQGPREEDLLIAAASKRAEGLYEQAIAAYDSLIEYYPNTVHAAAALSGCAETYAEYAAATGDTTINQAKLDYLEEQAEHHTNPDVKIVANLYLAREYEYKSQWHAAKDIYTELLQDNPVAGLKAIIYRALVNLNARGLKDFDAANQIIVNMVNEIPGSNHIEISRLDLALFTGEKVQITGSGLGKSTADFKNKSDSNVPSRYSLEQNFPNPFNPSTEIWFKLGDDSFINLRLYDILGREIKTLASGYYPNGYHRVILDASDFSSGIYTYRLEATSTNDPSKNFLQVRKMLLIK